MFYSNTLISDVLIILIIVCKNIENWWMNVELCVYKLVPLHLCWHLCVSVHVSGWLCVYVWVYREESECTYMWGCCACLYFYMYTYVSLCVCVCAHVCLCVYTWVSLCVHVHLYVCDIWNTHVYSLSLYRKFIDFSLRTTSLVRIRAVFSYCVVYILSQYLTLLYVEMHRRTILHTKTMCLRMNWVRRHNWEK